MSARRRDEIEAAIAAYNAALADRRARLTPTAIRLLLAMFPSEDVCQLSLSDLARAGFDRRAVPRLLRRLVEVGFLLKELGSGHAPNIYRLHLPPRRQP